MRRSVLVLVASALVVASCGSTDSGPDADTSTSSDPAGVVESAGGLETVSAETAAGVIDADPEGLVVLDVRTPEEFADGHLDGAVLVDFYDADFRDQLAGLDPNVPYVLYCRSGNRSGETLDMMSELGFASVDNVDGGIIAWSEAGLPVVID